MTHDMGTAAAGAHTHKLLSAIIEGWPQHEKHLQRFFSTLTAEDAANIDVVAKSILKLSDNELSEFVTDYRWMCGMFMKHEIAFRRSMTLSNTDTAAIRDAYYDNADAMGRYMRGLLISQITWPQHLGVQFLFAREFMPRLPSGFSYMEVGPGHGVTRAGAGADPKCGRLSGCDISQTSIDMTRQSMVRLGVTRPVDLIHADICAATDNGNRFDAILISQVLELVESPQSAIENLAIQLAPQGQIFVNCPVQMLAPDHIRDWRSGADIVSLVEAAGLTVEFEAKVHADASEKSENLGYSHVLIARKPG